MFFTITLNIIIKFIFHKFFYSYIGSLHVCCFKYLSESVVHSLYTIPIYCLNVIKNWIVIRNDESLYIFKIHIYSNQIYYILETIIIVYKANIQSFITFSNSGKMNSLKLFLFIEFILWSQLYWFFDRLDSYSLWLYIESLILIEIYEQTIFKNQFL